VEDDIKLQPLGQLQQAADLLLERRGALGAGLDLDLVGLAIKGHPHVGGDYLGARGLGHHGLPVPQLGVAEAAHALLAAGARAGGGGE
jgi:hypothetical protein